MGIKSMSVNAARGAVVAAVLAVPLAFTVQASADVWVSDNCAVATPVSDCESQTNVLFVFYNSVDKNGYTGSGRATFLGKVPDYAGVTVYSGSPTVYHYVFAAGTAGSGVAVKNNAASVLACGSTANYRVYFNSSYLGHQQYISGDWGCNNGVNLDSVLHNNNASQAWG
jgi:hypothetical protein